MAPLIERVCSPAVCSFGSKIYVFGGQEGVTMKGYPGMFEDCVLHLPFHLRIGELTVIVGFTYRLSLHIK